MEVIPVSDAPPPAGKWTEPQRLAELDRYRVMDTAPESQFDDIVKVAAQVCGVPMALISLVDSERQWFKAALGVSAPETPRDIAFCAHAIQQQGLFTVPDAHKDARFEANPLVTGDPNLRFYAGAPLETPDGFPLGTLCVLDTVPRELTGEQEFALQALARQVMAQLELRRALADQRAADALHRQIVESATDFAIVTADTAGMLTSWNSGAENIFGWTEEEALGQPLAIFFTQEDRRNGVPEHEMRRSIDTGHAADDRWHLRRDGTRFWASGEMMPMLDDAGARIGFLKIVRDRTEARHMEEHRDLLTGELQHRVKNTLAVVQAITSQSLRKARTPGEARAAIEDRLFALGKAHDLLTAVDWTGAPLTRVVDAAIAGGGIDTHRFEIAGPALDLTPRAALALSLALHELTTNAIKYGALSAPEGRVLISWTRDSDADRFRFEWRETGGPPVTAPTAAGFGSRLIQSGARDVGGASRFDYATEGVIWTLDGKLSAMAPN